MYQPGLETINIEGKEIHVFCLKIIFISMFSPTFSSPIQRGTCVYYGFDEYFSFKDQR